MYCYLTVNPLLTDWLYQLYSVYLRDTRGGRSAPVVVS